MKKALQGLAASEVYKPAGRREIKLGMLTLVLLILIFLLALKNAGQLRSALNRSTEEYLSDITARITADIRDTMQHRIDLLTLMADVLSQESLTGDSARLKQYLIDKAAEYQYSALVLLDQKGILASSNPDSYHPDPKDLLNLPAVQSSFLGKTNISYFGGENIFYSVPVTGDRRIQEVLIGVRNKESMQAMISSKSFDGHSLSCIIDHTGQVIISPKDLMPFLQLEDIFVSSGTATPQLQEMQSNMLTGRDGHLYFTSVSQEELLLSYNALGFNDWFLLTLVPADLITGSADLYILRLSVILFATILIFVILAVILYRLYLGYSRQLERIAFLDEVTGGPNNLAFQMQFQKTAKEILPGAYSIVLLNVKDFKLVNIRLGKQGGDQVLGYIYRVIQRHLRPEKKEFAARSEADHFFLCLEEGTPQGVRQRLEEIICDINSFRDTTLPRYHLSFRQGACFVRNPQTKISLLQDWARTAHQKAAAASFEACVFYDEQFIQQLANQQELNDLFEESIENRYFQVYLQPKVRLSNSSIGGAEALIRWQHPKKGLIHPSDFIPLFEENGKICRLDLYVFEEVCSLLRRWRESGAELIPISVNLSRQHFYLNSDFLNSFAELKQRYNIPDGILELELTENTMFYSEKIQEVKSSIVQMHRLGLRCSLDDFGFGFSSLSLLREFDVDTLKLDRSFFEDISDPKARDVISCLLQLAKRLKLETVAEGIETLDQLAYLKSVPCDMIQGYLFSKPLPIPDFEAWVTAFHGSNPV